jgi:galactokinase
MTRIPPKLRISTPGRICLFGEHQDYLGLPVIPCAISLRIAIEGRHIDAREAHIDLPDIASREVFPFQVDLPYPTTRNYFRSVFNVLQRNGYTFSKGVECTVRGKIPINSGTSSSSALVVSWVGFLVRMSDQKAELAPADCARLAHAAEVLEFNEPGGMMDHYSTALGGIIALDFLPGVRYETLTPPLGTFVLGDSQEPKDTVRILANVKNRILGFAGKLKTADAAFSLQTMSRNDVENVMPWADASDRTLLSATLLNRDLTSEARRLFKAPVLDHVRVGQLLNDHQAALRDGLKISTPKIDRMLGAAMKAGALGGKINGSGGGGCMFAYAPVNPEAVAEAIRSVGGKAYVVHADAGTRSEQVEERHA